jgi:hypothetical protein
MRKEISHLRSFVCLFWGLMTLVCVIAFAPYGLAGVTYYVRPDGSDPSAGTQNVPGGAWRTIQRAANVMKGGDTVSVADGIYPEVVRPVDGGSSLMPITYQASGSNVVVDGFVVSVPHVVIKGFVILGNVPGYSGAVTLRSGAEYVQIVSNSFRSTPVNVYQLFVYQTATNVHDALIVGNRFENGYYHAVGLGGGRHVVSNNVFTSPNGGDALRVTASDVVIAGNVFTNWSNVALTSAPLKIGIGYWFKRISSDASVDWSNVGAKKYYECGAGVTFVATGPTPTAWGSAVVRESGATNNIASPNALVVGRLYYFISNSGNPDFDNVGASAIRRYLVGEAYGFTATQAVPTVWGNGTTVLNKNHSDIVQAFHVDGRPAQRVVFERNSVIDCPNVQFGNMEDQLLIGNVSDWVFRNNLFVNVSARMNLYAPGFRFLNNTFYRCGFDSGDVLNWRVASKGVSSNLWFVNNIMVECGYADRSNSGWYSGALTNDQFCDYNLVLGRDAGRVKDVAMWRLYGREVHGFNGVDPLFVNPSALDFRLQTNSPVIGAGTNLSAYFTSDYEGNLRSPQWDMGAFPSVAASRKSLSSDTLRPNPPAQVRSLP